MTKDLILIAVQKAEDDPEQVICWYQDQHEVSRCELADLPEQDLESCLALSPNYAYQLLQLPRHVLVKTTPLDHPDLAPQV